MKEGKLIQFDVKKRIRDERIPSISYSISFSDLPQEVKDKVIKGLTTGCWGEENVDNAEENESNNSVSEVINVDFGRKERIK